MTRLDLADRCLQDPRHLAESCRDHFETYAMGYDIARRAQGLPALVSGFDWEAAEKEFRSMIPSADSWPGNNRYDSYLEVKHSCSKDAFSEWISVCRRFPVISEPPGEIPRPVSILDLVNDPMRTRPALYFGNTADAGSIWTLFSGFCWAERDLGVFPSGDGATLSSFQSWMEERYPFAKGNPWYRALRALSLNSSKWSLDLFYSAFDLYRKGGNPDDLGARGSLVEGLVLGELSEDEKKAIRRVIPE
jgi:hypothetical protein